MSIVVARPSRISSARSRPAAGAVHEAVAGVSGVEIEAPDVLGLAQDRMVVGRHFIESGPAAGDADPLHERQTDGGGFQMGQLPVLVHGLVEGGRLVGPRHPGEKPGAFAVEVEVGAKSMTKVQSEGISGVGRGREELAPDGLDGDVQPGHAADQTGPGPGRVDHDGRGDRPLVGLDAGDAAGCRGEAP